MSTTSSAVPANLIRFGEQAAEIDDRLLALAGPLQDALDAFRRSGGEFAPPIPELDETLRQLARSARALDDRVTLVGRAFADAAHGRLARPVAVPDPLLLRSVPPRSFALEAHIGGDILDHIREIAEWIRDRAEPLGPLAEFLEDFPRHVDVVVEELVVVYRSARDVVEEVIDGVLYRTEWAVDEVLWYTRWLGRTIDLTWLRRAAPWLRRLGQVGDVLVFPLAAWEQWEQDAGRSDLSSTERVLRAGVDAGVRGAVQALIGSATAGLAAPLAAGGPPGWVAAAAVIAGGVVVGEVADELVDGALDWGYERWDWLVEDAAGAIDDTGRWIGDRVEDAGDMAGDVLDDVRDAGSGARRWAGDRVDDAGDVVDAVTPW